MYMHECRDLERQACNKFADMRYLNKRKKGSHDNF